MLSNNNFTDSFFEGFSSILDLCPKLELPLRFKTPISPAEADYIALKGDWDKIGHDIKNSMKKYDQSSQ